MCVEEYKFMIYRLLHNSARVTLRRMPKRDFATEKNKKAKSEANDDDIWDEDEDNQETEELTPTRKYMRYVKRALMLGVCGALAYNGYVAIDTKSDEELAKDYTGYNHYAYTVSNAIVSQVRKGYNYLLYPPVEKFLPDEPPLRADLLRKTLVLNFEGTLYAKDFGIGQGVLIHLRPGFKKFVDKMSQMYDIVLYSNEDTMFMTEVLQTIDPSQRYFSWNLGREFFTTRPDGTYKDLQFINRDPKKFIVVDFDTKNYLNHKDNIILLDQYKGAVEDNGLRELGLFLEHCAPPTVKDVRREIKKYGGEQSVKNYYEEMQKKVDSVKKKRDTLNAYKGQSKLVRI